MDWTTITVAVIAAVSSSGIWTYMDHRRQERREDKGLENVIADLVKGIARDIIVARSVEYLENGYISAEQMDSLTQLFEAYNRLGGNSHAERLYKKATNLPIVTNRQKERQEVVGT